MTRSSFTALAIGLFALSHPAMAQTGFANWENPHVHPLDLTPSGSVLLAVNTADGRLEVFNVSSGSPLRVGSIPVGVDPVSVRARTDAEAWVVNHISDSVSIVSLINMNVIATLKTDDEPADVVFAGSPRQAFVSCSQANTILVFDPGNLATPPVRISIDAEDPRAMAVGVNTSTGREQVYVAIFESGNHSTILGGGLTMAGGYPPNVVSDALGPYGGTNPPPNNGAGWNPPIKPPYLPNGATPAPHVGLIVKKNGAGQWMDDNAHDWTPLVSGPNAARSGRPPNWDLPDHDVAIIDTQGLGVTYANGLMNICMALAVIPSNQRVTVVGTDATNEVRFEPVVSGRFIHVNMGTVEPLAIGSPLVVDLNAHLATSYTRTVPFVPLPQSERNKSIGDPRGIVWNSTGTRGYVTGMGSNNVIVVDQSGNRLQPGNNAQADPFINVGEGPTGIVMSEPAGRIYVLNKFEGSLSVIDVATEREIRRVPLFDPSPSAIKTGRKHLYDTHRNSGLGQLSCASCHVDARMDRLAWDLGDPSGDIKAFAGNCIDGGCQNWHPMKGPMTTQTLQDIIGKEPHHWRGDRSGLEEFSGAFKSLLGGDAPLQTDPPSDEMQEFEDFLATVRMPPNPFRNFDNTLPTNLPLPGQFTTGRFGPAGQPLPNANAVNGLSAFRTAALDGGINCITCHTVPTGAGTDTTLQFPNFNPIPPGPDGEHHLLMVSVDGSTNITIKVPQLRNQYDKVGFETTQQFNRAGFGFFHDGSVDSLARFISEPVFSVSSNQQIADLVALVMSFSGSDYPPRAPLEPPGVASLDTPASVGTQITIDAGNKNSAPVIAFIAGMKSQADGNKAGWIAKGLQSGLQRGWQYLGSDLWQSDRQAETTNTANLRLAAANGSEITFTLVLKGTERRIGIDRDSDTHFDRDELDACSNPADSLSVPGTPVAADFNCDAHVDELDLQHMADCQTHAGVAVTTPGCNNADLDGDTDVDLDDLGKLQRCYSGPDRSVNPNCVN